MPGKQLKTAQVPKAAIANILLFMILTPELEKITNSRVTAVDKY
jgi:hypothetical protein